LIFLLYRNPQTAHPYQNAKAQTKSPDYATDPFINYFPQNTPSVASTSHYSTLATEPDIKSSALIDAWQNEGMTNCMMAWTAHDQGAGIVNPKDLFQASV